MKPDFKLLGENDMCMNIYTKYCNLTLNGARIINNNRNLDNLRYKYFETKWQFCLLILPYAHHHRLYPH